MSAAALLLLLAPLAAAADLGVPKDGFDRVLLDDGRVVDARALPREGDLVPLEFAAGTIRVSRARVVEVRPWRDFDPEPRDDAEKEKTDRGFVRWKGVLVPPEVAGRMRGEEVEKERVADREAARFESIGSIRGVPAGRFRVVCNGPPEDRKFWMLILSDLSREISRVMPKVEYPPTIGIALDYGEPLDPEEIRYRERTRDGHTWMPPVDSVSIGLEGVSRMDAVPPVLRAAAPRLVEKFVYFDLVRAGGWVRHGLGEYHSYATTGKGGLEFGAVDDDLLLACRRMEEGGLLKDLSPLLRTGTRFVDEVIEKAKATGKFEGVAREDSFDDRWTPAAWLLVHYLMEGDGGKHRRGFLGWFRCVADFDNKVGRNSTRTFDSYRGFLLRQVGVKDLDALAEGMRTHAAALKFREARTWLLLAGEALAKRKDAAEARALAEEAVAAAAGRSGDLVTAARFLAGLPDGATRAREVLEAAVAADPLNGDARMALATLLPPGEAETMRALGEALGGAAVPAAPPPK